MQKTEINQILILSYDNNKKNSCAVQIYSINNCSLSNYKLYAMSNIKIKMLVF